MEGVVSDQIALVESEGTPLERVHEQQVGAGIRPQLLHAVRNLHDAPSVGFLNGVQADTHDLLVSLRALFPANALEFVRFKEILHEIDQIVRGL